MTLLQNLNRVQILEADDLTKLSEDVVKELQKNIRDGAKDLDQLWANALELVHKAYDVAGVERPNPDMRDAWTQYEENLQYAVEQLAKYRGMDGDWRMSAAIFHEAMQKPSKFRIEAIGDTFGEAHTINAKTVDEVIDSLKIGNTDLYDIDVEKTNEQSATVTFSKWGIRKNYKLKIDKIV